MATAAVAAARVGATPAPMADPVQSLLALQELDSALDRLAHRRATLPERRTLAEAEAAIQAVASELDAGTRRTDELAAEIRRREEEVAANEARAASVEATLDSGSGGSPRDLAAMADEVQSIRRRIRSLEDALLDLLEEAETAAAAQSDLRHRRDEHAAAVASASEALAAADAELDAEEADLAPRRQGLVDGIPADLVSTYERLRAHMGGVAVAQLEGARCGGCHLTLPAMELDALRHAPPGVVVRHEECGRILVRP